MADQYSLGSESTLLQATIEERELATDQLNSSQMIEPFHKRTSSTQINEVDDHKCEAGDPFLHNMKR